MSAPTAPAAKAELRRRIEAVSIRDRHRLSRQLAGKHDQQRLLRDLAAAEARIERRRAGQPAISYPPELPVSQRHDDLLAAIRDHQVVVIAGETGSGKTTQIPKLCLELGRGVLGTIGHTQPRRIAARSVAERIAAELDTEVGQAVGYAVRFTDRISDGTLVKLMTDGILLAEIARDRLLRGYDTIIIDEAHERSLNIDFLLGYLKQLLPQRPDLKLIITSATIDPQRFADYFGGCPVLEVSGRGYPVELRYRPLADPDGEDRDQVSGIVDAVLELAREPAGDVLVFLSGEREIRDAADALTSLELPATEVLPLYARLSAAEQHRVFTGHPGRRIVLATNVAETSLTVPGIKYVIDTGTARISRYSQRTKVQLLPIEPISQASARQRAGRCGRTSAGICIRLYDEQDYQNRPEFTDPEIVRTNLASVILAMATMDLGDVERFGFLDPPDARQVSDGVQLLVELGALSATGGRRRLTELGRQLAQLPIDPRLARMVLEADKRGCLRDVLVLAAALSIQDPRERPAEHQQAADAQHARFADPKSDFSSYLNLWNYLSEQQASLSGNQFRRLCKAEYLNFLRVREWQDLVGQLRQIVKGMGVRIGNQPTDPEQLHRSLLAGLLSHIGQRDPARRDYLGARGARFAVFPGSGLFKKQPDFLMAAELVETSRLYARVNASISAEWAEELAPHLVKRTYSEPHWERRRAAVMATERVTLYGVPLVVGRKVGYHRIDPALSRELFIRHALVEGDWESRHHFFRHNRELVAEVGELENRARRRDLMVDDETIFAFYERRIPESVVSGRHFDSWWKKARHRTPELLDLQAEDLVRAGAGDVSTEQFPDRWSSGDFSAELSYRFHPGSSTDGVTVGLPLAALPAATGLDWQVPGLRSDLVTGLLRTLPKPLRRQLVPIPDTATELIADLPPAAGQTAASLTTTLSELLARRGVPVPATAWQLDALPPHLRPTYQVLGPDGRVLGASKDLDELKAQFAPKVIETVQSATADISRDRLTDWDFDELPRQVRRRVDGVTVTGYPALADEAGTVAVRVFETPTSQLAAHRAGVRRLLLESLPSPVKSLIRGVSPQSRLLLGRAPHGSPAALLDDVIAAAVDHQLQLAEPLPWRREEYQRVRDQVAAGFGGEAARLLGTVEQIVAAGQQVELALAELSTPPLRVVRVELEAQLHGLLYPGFVLDTGAIQLPQLPRYLQAMARRAADARLNLARDRDRQGQVAVLLADLAELRASLGDGPGPARIRWLIEEFRVSVFAQQLGTAVPVSIRRIQAAMDEVEDAAG